MNEPKLKWKPVKSFDGEFECRVGALEYSVSSEGHWDVSSVAILHGRNHLATLACGQVATLAQAKRKCQNHCDRQWRAMMRLKG